MKLINSAIALGLSLTVPVATTFAARFSTSSPSESSTPALSQSSGIASVSTLADFANAIAPQPQATNELIVRLDPTLSDAQRDLLFHQANLELIRPLRFTDNTYLVDAPETAAIEMTTLTQQVQGMRGVLSAEPNVIQGATQIQLEDQSPTAIPITELDRHAWHIDSTGLRGHLQPRTDIQAKDAWEISNQGAGVTVAVIDSTIQTTHPDLMGAIACLDDTTTDPLPDETCGWDFIENDPQPSLSPEETMSLNQDLQNTFMLSDAELLATYPHWTAFLGHLPIAEQADTIRQFLQHRVQATFHGTWSAGIIAARPQSEVGLHGVAPQTQILPVRVFDLDGNTTTATLIEATGYAAARGVDVINLSLGGLLPSESFVHHLFELMGAHPDLVIVASAGNSNLDGVGFPAAIPGVISVGATTLEGERSPYSHYGGQLDLVAPGGDLRQSSLGGILTTGGTGLAELWEEIPLPEKSWGYSFDQLGAYVRVQGTSFSAPNVAGVVALMKGEDPKRQLNREEIFEILQETSSYESLTLSHTDVMNYRLQRELGFGTFLDMPFFRDSGVYRQPNPVRAEEYYFGAGLVNAIAAVKAVQER
ncbi:MAG: S8 family serine peptidase [Symploca sp. SIO2B6]|nr:S8 family serine peptidase [Symploca sp. SIO2B6]